MQRATSKLSRYRIHNIFNCCHLQYQWFRVLNGAFLWCICFFFIVIWLLSFSRSIVINILSKIFTSVIMNQLHFKAFLLYLTLLIPSLSSMRGFKFVFMFVLAFLIIFSFLFFNFFLSCSLFLSRVRMSYSFSLPLFLSITFNSPASSMLCNSSTLMSPSSFVSSYITTILSNLEVNVLITFFIITSSIISSP